MQTPLFKSIRKNSTSLYVFPSVEEDKNFESQNENYKMNISHFVLVNFPRQTTEKLNFDNVFEQNGSSTQPANFKDQLVESLRNYVANQDVLIRNTKINQTDYYYDPNEIYTTTEKIFWKWCHKLGIIDFEIADNVDEFNGADSKYNQNISGNNNYFREYLWKERSKTVYNTSGNIEFGVISGSNPIPTITPTIPTSGYEFATITLTASTNFKIGDYVVINKSGLDLSGDPNQSIVKIVGLDTNSTVNDMIVVEVIEDSDISGTGFEIYNAYERFVQFISEIGGNNNVQLPDKAYIETFGYVSNQHGQIPYSLWNIKNDNNYKPNSQFPILPGQIQYEIQGGEDINNPILTQPNNYPGDIWAHYDEDGAIYTTSTGDINRRQGDYYGITVNNVNDLNNLKYPAVNSEKLDGLTLNLNINDYTKATSYVYPIESFNEFCSTAFNNQAPNDFKFNAILWYYTIEDVTGNTTETATNLYGVEFLDTPDNDYNSSKTLIPEVKKYVSNGLQDGNAYTFSLDINISIDSDTAPPSFDPEKVYSLFGMDLFYEALTRITYFNDQLTNYVNSNIQLTQKVNDLTGLVYNQQDLETIENRMNNIENLLNVYSTLQIGNSDTIQPFLDTSVNPAVLRLNSIDKKYGIIYSFNTKDMYSEYITPNNTINYNINEKTVSLTSGKDSLIIIKNNDNSTSFYDSTNLSNLSITIDKDLEYKQTLDFLILPKENIGELIKPFLDKGIDIYINYNNNVSTTKHLLGSFNLPVMNYKSGSSYYNENNTFFKEQPNFKIKRVIYRNENSTTRKFKFIIDGDLGNLGKLNDDLNNGVNSRILINNLEIQDISQSIPYPYFNLTDQYPISTVSYQSNNIINAVISNIGNGYINGDADLKAGSINYGTVGCVQQSGQLTDISFTKNNGYLINNEQIVDIDQGGNTTAKAKLYTSPLTVITVDFNINETKTNSLLSAYDTLLNGLVELDITDKFKTAPEITFLAGYKISLTRISSDNDIPVVLFNQKYAVEITHL